MAPDAYRFDVFEVRPRTRSLLCNGQRVGIQELPFQLLLILLETRGRLVSREELRNRLWDQKTFGDFDHSLGVAVAKLREALGDHATAPRFIKTVSGQGYLFIGDVTPVVASLAKLPLTGWRVLPIAIASILAIVVVASTIIFTHKYTHRPLAGNQDKVVVGGFANSTDDHEYDSTLSFAFRVKLEESSYLSLIPDQEFRRLVKNPDSATLENELHACASLSGQVLLRGQIITQSLGYQVLLTAWRCADGRLLTTQEARASSRTAVLSALDLATEQMRRRLGESDSSPQNHIPLTQATTASMDALKAFTLGEEKRRQGLIVESISDYRRAVDLDPQFALAYARLGVLYSDMVEYSLSRQNLQAAYNLRERATVRGRFSIVTLYYTYATGEVQRAVETYQLWRAAYPRDYLPANNLASEYLILAQPQKAIELARIAIQMNSGGDDLPYATLAGAYLQSGDYADLNLLCNDPVRGETGAVQFHFFCFHGAFAQNDAVGMQRQLQWAHGNPQESLLLASAAWVAMYRGRALEADRLFSEAQQSAFKNNLVELAAAIGVDQANFEADLGFTRKGRRSALGALELAPSSAPVQALAALAFARVGDIARAQANARKARLQSPLDTILNSAELASVHAAIQLQKHDPESAIESLEGARPFDFCAYMELAPPYYRGLAYLQSKHPQEAAREFQQVIDHRAIAPASVYVVLSQLQLGRALQMEGDGVNAARIYHEVENIWKDADPGFPPLQQVRVYQRELAAQQPVPPVKG